MDLNHLRASDGTGEAVLAHIQSVRTVGSTVLDLDNVDNWNSKVIVVTGTPAANGYIASAGMTVMYGHITAGDLIIDGFAPGYSDNGNTTSQVALVKMCTAWADTLVDILSIAHQDNGKLKTTALDDFFKPSELIQNFVASGGIVAQTVGLTGSFSNIVYYINGLRYTKNTIPNKVYTASKDTYVDIDSAGNITYTEAANGGENPVLAANSIRIARVVTNGATITSIRQNFFDANDSPIRPNSPNGEHDTGWITPVAEAGGTALVAGFAGTFQYRRIGNKLYLRGSIQRGAGAYPAGYTTVVTLPFGFRIKTIGTRLAVASYQGASTAALIADVGTSGIITIAPQGSVAYDNTYFGHVLLMD